IDRMEHSELYSMTPANALISFIESLFDWFYEYSYISGLLNDHTLHKNIQPESCSFFIKKSPHIMQKIKSVFLEGKHSGVFRDDISVEDIIIVSILLVEGYFTHSEFIKMYIGENNSNSFNQPETWKKFCVEFIL